MTTARLGRRALLGGALAAGAVASAGLGGCAGLTERVSSTSRGSGDRLTVQVYGTDTETAFYDRLARRYEEQNPSVTIDLTAVPFAEAATAIDAGLVSGTAPDVFRVDYPTMGLYAGTGQLLDLTDALDELAGDVSPAFMQAVTQGDRYFGIPQHVDTTALLYRPDALRDAGITSVPDRLEDAWSWDELSDVADTLRDAAPQGTSAFAVNWQALGAFRWLTWVFMAGGHLYDADQERAVIDDDAGRRALEFTSSFFDRGWVPPQTSTNSATYPDAIFTSGALSMLFGGNFLLPAFAETIGDRFEYAVTYQPQDERQASEIGGNGLVATHDVANPDLATDFLLFLGAPAQMRDFCTAAVLAPTRRSLQERPLDYEIGADLMPVYLDQISTIQQRDVADVTTPTFAEVNQILADELEGCFLSGDSVEATIEAIASRVDDAADLNDAVAGS